VLLKLVVYNTPSKKKFKQFVLSGRRKIVIDINWTNTFPESDLIIFPAYNIGYSELFYFLKSLPHMNLMDRILLICTDQLFNMLTIPVPHCITDEFDQLPRLLEKIETMGKQNQLSYKAVLGIDEEMQFQLSKSIAHHFGLYFYDQTSCLKGSNKFLLKTSFEQNGVPTSPFKLIENLNPKKISAVGFPNVLKLMSGSQSQYIFRNENMTQLRKNFQLLKEGITQSKENQPLMDPRFKKQNLLMDGQSVELNPETQFLLEAYVPGVEFSCDFIVQDDNIQIIRIIKKVAGPYFGFFMGYLLLTQEQLDQDHFLSLLQICKRISQSFSIDSGVCMVDFKIHQDQITVLESSIRPGLSAFNHLMYVIYGYTSLALMAMQKMGLPINVKLPQQGGAVVYIYGTQKGVIRSWGGLLPDAPDPLMDIIYIHEYDDEEDNAVSKQFDPSSMLRGYVLLRNLDMDKLPELSAYLNHKAGGFAIMERAS